MGERRNNIVVGKRHNEYRLYVVDRLHLLNGMSGETHRVSVRQTEGGGETAVSYVPPPRLFLLATPLCWFAGSTNTTA